ncbi:MAG: hypothetical protein KDC80_24365 [Saprospiraceae bacterium]|nr:hypothetical protein [Saprospiraceae bacterium]
MQIVQYIPHPRYKITVFKSGRRYIVKFDDADHDLSLKFREGEVDGLKDVVSQVNQELLEEIDQVFETLSSFRMSRYQRSSKRFPDII